MVESLEPSALSGVMNSYRLVEFLAWKWWPIRLSPIIYAFHGASSFAKVNARGIKAALEDSIELNHRRMIIALNVDFRILVAWQ